MRGDRPAERVDLSVLWGRAVCSQSDGEKEEERHRREDEQQPES